MSEWKQEQEHSSVHRNDQPFPSLASRSNCCFFVGKSYSLASFSSCRWDVLRCPVKVLPYFLIACSANPGPISLNPSPNHLTKSKSHNKCFLTPLTEIDASWFSMVHVLFHCSIWTNPFVPYDLWLEGVNIPLLYILFPASHVQCVPEVFT